MGRVALRREVVRLQEALRGRTRAAPTLAQLRADPAAVFTLAGLTPDPWQGSLLCDRPQRLLCLNGRQTGKSTIGAGLAVATIVLRPASLVLVLSPTQRQSAELFRKATALYRRLGRPVPVERETVLSLELANGSRLLALPGDEEGIRGYSGAALVILDEASRTRDALYASVRPMLSTSNGALVALTTPFGARGWFHEAWRDGGDDWRRVRVRADECPRIPAEFLAQERRAMGPRWYAQEYECEFVDSVDSVFTHSDVLGALATDVEPLFQGAA